MEEKYSLGYDFRACARLNTQHLVWQRLQGYLTHPSVSLKSDCKIADIGSGTGAWLLDLSRQLPKTAQLDGLDINLRLSPHPRWLPANVSFSEFDIHGEIPEDMLGAYDLVHVRFFICVVKDAEPGPVIDSLKRMLKPGGYLQWTEMDMYSISVAKTSEDMEAPANEEAVRRLKEVLCRRSGEEPGWTVQLADAFQARGFESIVVNRRRSCPDDYANFHDTALLTLEEMSHYADGGEQLVELIEKAAEELGECRRGVAFTADSVTTVGQKGQMA